MRIDEDSFGCGEAVTCGRGLVAETPDPEEEHADADEIGPGACKYNNK